jgi:hypothetical protein
MSYLMVSDSRHPLMIRNEINISASSNSEKILRRAGDEAEVVEHMPLKGKALSCNPNICRNHFKVEKEMKISHEQKHAVLIYSHLHLKL